MAIRWGRPAYARYSKPISNSPNKPALARSKTRQNSSPSTWAVALQLLWPWFGAGGKQYDESSVHAGSGWPLWISGVRSKEKREMVRARARVAQGIRIRKRRCYRQRQRHDRTVQRQTIARNDRSHVVSSAG